MNDDEGLYVGVALVIAVLVVVAFFAAVGPVFSDWILYESP